MIKHSVVFLRLLLSVMFLSALSSPVLAQDSDADTVFEELQAVYADAEALSASFHQHVVNPFGDEFQNEGTLYVSGDKYRVELEDQTIVADGETTWIHNHADRQVLVNEYQRDADTFAPTTFLLQLDDSYRPVETGSESVDGVALRYLKLESEDPGAMFVSFVMRFQEDDLRLRRVEIEDANETRMTFTLRDLDLDTELGDDLFAFDPPENVEVVDLRP